MNEKTIIPISNKTLRAAMYAVHAGRCFYSGRHVNKGDMEIDHILPRSLGGEDCIENYVLTSKSLNVLKGDTVVAEMVDRMKYINKCCYTSRVVAEYLRLSPYPQGYVTLRDYLKEKHNKCPRIDPTLPRYIQRNVLHQKIDTGRRRNTIVYDRSGLDVFLNSRTCDACGTVNRELTLPDRTWTCACGAEHDRDYLAARNIKRFALANENLKYTGAGRSSELLDARCCNAGG